MNRIHRERLERELEEREHVRELNQQFPEKDNERLALLDYRASDLTYRGTKRKNALPTTSLADRFWPKVDKTETCWLWTAGKDNKGYGCLATGTGFDRAHRVAWILCNGEIKDGLEVCHKCDNPSCCNPDHLFLGTHAENMGDCVKKERQSRGEKNGHAIITEEIVRSIRRLASQGMNRTSIANKFSLGKTHVDKIIWRTRWKHVKD